MQLSDSQSREPFSKRSVNFNWGSEKVRGLNIGGWLLLEPWITPSIFESVDQSLGIVDEYTLTEKLGSDAAYNILKPHVRLHINDSDLDITNVLCSGTAGVPSQTSRKLQMPASIWFGYRSDIGLTHSMLESHTLKVQRHTLMLLSTGLEAQD